MLIRSSERIFNPMCYTGKDIRYLEANKICNSIALLFYNYFLIITKLSESTNSNYFTNININVNVY